MKEGALLPRHGIALQVLSGCSSVHFWQACLNALRRWVSLRGRMSVWEWRMSDFHLSWRVSFRLRPHCSPHLQCTQSSTAGMSLRKLFSALLALSFFVLASSQWNPFVLTKWKHVAVRASGESDYEWARRIASTILGRRWPTDGILSTMSGTLNGVNILTPTIADWLCAPSCQWSSPLACTSV